MRNPSAEKELLESSQLKLVPLDVQNPASVGDAVATSLKTFGKVDVWVNNAGYGVFGPVEAASRAQIQRQFDVNVFGLIECVQAIAPHFRKNRSGVLINVTSIGGLMTPPGYAIYTSSKFAVEGLSEGLWYELGAFGIKVKVIEPGVVSTNFSGRSMDVLDSTRFPDYATVIEKINAGGARLIKNRSEAGLVAAKIYQAANDRSDRLRYLVGPDAKRLWSLRRWFGYQAQMRVVRNMVKLWD